MTSAHLPFPGHSPDLPSVLCPNVPYWLVHYTVVPSPIMDLIDSTFVLVELQRAKRTGEVLLVRKIGNNPSSLENLVITSPY